MFSDTVVSTSGASFGTKTMHFDLYDKSIKFDVNIF